MGEGQGPTPHSTSPQVHEPEPAFCRPARRRRFWSFNRSTGFKGVSGSRRSRRDNIRRARIHRKRLASWTEEPSSSRSTVRFETPASAARPACVTPRASRTSARRRPSSVRIASSDRRSSNIIIRHYRRIVGYFPAYSPYLASYDRTELLTHPFGSNRLSSR